MKDIGIRLLVIAAAIATRAPAEAAELPLIPWPDQVELQAGHFHLNRQTVVVADPVFAHVAAQLSTALNLTVAPPAPGNRILLTTNGADGLGGEAYRLEVDAAGATIRARDAAGAFYGCQTFRQLAKPGAIPAVKITDAPRCAWRGLMLDVSRHFFDKSTVRRVLDWMADYKLNRLHLHLTDDQGWRLEIQKYPELTRIGARGNFSDTNAAPRFFTRAEMRELVAYAAERHIIIVPELDMPGHASAATRTFPQLDGGMHTFNPAREETYDFLQNVLLDVMDTFSSPWIHFGGDEVNCSGWNQDVHVAEKMRAEGLENPRQLEGYFVRRVTGFIQQQGRTPVGWDEIVNAQPSSNTVVFWWRQDKPEMLERALAGGYSVVMSPRTPCYLNYPQDKSFPKFMPNHYNTPADVYAGPKIPAGISAAHRRQILGVEACVWTEYIATVPHLEFTLLPRLIALAEMAWTPDDRRDFVRFSGRQEPFLNQHRQAGVHYYDAAQPLESLHDALPPENQPAAAARADAHSHN